MTLVGVMLVGLVSQSGALAVLLTAPLEEGSPLLAQGTTFVSVLAAFSVAYDAREVSRSDAIDWSPRTLAWGPAALLPGLNLGVVLAYAGRRFERRTGRGRDRWVVPAVVGAVTSGVGLLVVVTVGGAQPFPLEVALLQVGTLALVGLTTPAIYYDTSYVGRRLLRDGDRWLLGGYHWVAALSLPFPLRGVLAAVYLLRRRTLLAGAPEPGSTEPDASADGEAPAEDPGPVPGDDKT